MLPLEENARNCVSLSPVNSPSVHLEKFINEASEGRLLKSSDGRRWKGPRRGGVCGTLEPCVLELVLCGGVIELDAVVSMR